jgi:Family of unknown function (DUF6082)
MAADEHPDASDMFRRALTIRNGALFFLAFCIGGTLISLGITAALASALGQSRATSMGNVGQIFESVNATFSGLGFIALVVTFRVQYEELRLERQELMKQHAAMDKSQRALVRSAETDIRMCHMELMRMSMEDEDLATVWPEVKAGQSPTRIKQFTYANLIVQHQRLMRTAGVYTDADVIAFFRYLFTSPVIRDFWEARAVARQVITPEASAEWEFEQLVDVAYREIHQPEQASAPAAEPHANVVDLDSRRQPNSDAV